MKHLRIALLLCLMPFLGVQAQDEAEVPTPKFGYLSYNAVFERMPEYQQAQEAFAQLKAKYDAEAVHSEEEFQRKFAEFLQGQKDFPASIMQKRQAELQDLMEKSVSFRQQSRDLLRKAEADLQKPVATALDEAIQAVGAEMSLDFVLNTDGNSLPFINPQVGVDVTKAVLVKLGIEQPEAATEPTEETQPEAETE